MRFLGIILVVIASFFNLAYAADTPAVELNNLLNSMSTLSADFQQTITDPSHKDIQKASGKMALQRPGKFRWESLKPNVQLVIANGKRLWIYDPDLEQVTVRLISKEMGETPALLLSNTEETLNKNFTVKESLDADQIKWFILIPTNQNSMLMKIKLGFMNNKIKSMVLEDHLGHVTQIEFNHVNMNGNLAASLFQFKPPAGVDVIDETQQR